MKLNQYQQEMQQLLNLQDQEVNRQLYDLYVDTVKELKQSLLVEYQNYENLSRSKKMDLQRMSAMLETIDSQSQKLKAGLNGMIPDHLEKVGKMAYNELFYEYEQTRSAIQFALLPEEELKTIIETPVAGLRLSERINDGVVSDLRRNIKSELTRSFVHGHSYQKTAKRLSELGSSSYRRALNITRTEAGRVSAISRQRSQKEAVDLGIEFQKMWVATLDKRTRNTHQHLDGQQVDPEEFFEHNGLKTLQPHMFGIAREDCNCRCRTISRLKGDDTPLLRRDNETGDVVEYKNYKEWEEVKNAKSVEKSSDKVYNQGMERMKRNKDPNKRRPVPVVRQKELTKLFRERGGKVWQDEEAFKYLELQGADAICLGSDLIVLQKRPIISEILEELYHADQHFKGEINTDSRRSIVEAEIAAQRYLLSVTDKYKIPRSEVKQTQRALEAYLKELEGLK